MLTEHDIDNLLSIDDFGIEAVYTPMRDGVSFGVNPVFFGEGGADDFGEGGNTSRVINIIFDSPFQVALIAGMNIEAVAPVATCKSSDIGNVRHGDTITISGTRYYIVGVHPYSPGFTMLILSLENEK